MDLPAVAAFLAPYEPSPTVWMLCGGALGLFVLGFHRLGRRGERRSLPAAAAFLLGLALIYVSLQTRADYYAQHLFFLHRLQHLVLHHLGPFLIAWSAPQAVFAAALGGWMWARRMPGYAQLGRAYRAVQQPAVAGVLFVGLIWFWLVPELHPAAMLSLPLYNLMNWGMAVDGLLFWWMILNMRAVGESPGHYVGARLLVLALIMLPQILIGSLIAMSRQDLYPIYALCGRLLPIDPMTDQQLGGLITWIPAAMMSVLGALVLARRWLIASDRASAEPVLIPTAPRSRP